MKLAIVAAALSILGGPPARAPIPATEAEPAGPDKTFRAAPAARNVHQDRPGCVPILRQVQEESKRSAVRRGEARTLDREPSAHLLLAVDRQVAGCREVTFLRRNAAPGSVMPNPRLQGAVRP